MRKILPYYKPYLLSLLAIIALLFGQAMCELALPGYMSDIINQGIIKQDLPLIYHVGVFMILISAGSVLFAISSNFVAVRTASGASRDLRRGLFHKVTALSTGDMGTFSTASLITRSTNDIQTIQQTSVVILRMAFYAPLLGVGALLKALHTSPSLTWTIGLALLLILCLMVALFLLVMPKFKKIQSALDALNLIVGERLSGLLTVRAFGAEEAEEVRFDGQNRSLTKIGTFVNRSMSFLFPALMFVMNAVSLLVLWVGSHMAEAGQLMIGDMLAFLQYAMQVIFSFLFITMMFIMVPRAAVSAQRIGEVLQVEPSILESTENQEPSLQGQPVRVEATAGISANSPAPLSARTAAATSGILKFRDVGFLYPGAEDYALHHISFTAWPGQTTAIIGSTGSGKSSIIQLIPRLFDPTEGEILLDGVNIKNLPLSSLRRSLGYVPQRSLLFSGTIASNLRCGKEGATEEEMWQALRIAQARSFVQEMPKSLDAPVAQGGTTLSGGQQQRLAIARALIKQPQIYLFDDSFSALDFQTDAALRKDLRESTGKSTRLLVAQRVHTIMDADQIIVLHEGEIVGSGTHGELLQTCRIYQEIAASQLDEEDLRKVPHPSARPAGSVLPEKRQGEVYHE